MHPSLRCCSARAHTPLIKFLGKRSWATKPDSPHPHPAAPSEVQQRFTARASSSSAKPSKNESSEANVYNDFWEAPSRFWNPRNRQLTTEEVNAIMSGGASSY